MSDGILPEEMYGAILALSIRRRGGGRQQSGITGRKRNGQIEIKNPDRCQPGPSSTSSIPCYLNLSSARIAALPAEPSFRGTFSTVMMRVVSFFAGLKFFFRKICSAGWGSPTLLTAALFCTSVWTFVAGVSVDVLTTPNEMTPRTRRAPRNTTTSCDFMRYGERCVDENDVDCESELYEYSRR